MKKDIGKTGRDDSQQMIIETSQLLIKGNIMCWHGTMIQLSNVSCISTVPLGKLEFPILSLVLLLIGIIFLQKYLIISIMFFIVTVVWIYKWYKINEQRKKDMVLNIIMNSGNNLQFIINNKDFLDKVLIVLEQIIIEGGVGKQNMSINIQRCTFAGNAKVLNDLNLS